MASGIKTVQKIRRKAKKVKVSIDNAFKESNKADKRPKVTSKSKAYSMFRRIDRRLERNFGEAVVGAKPVLAVNLTVSVSRVVYGAGYAIELTMPANLLTFCGFQPGDIVTFLSGQADILNQHLAVVAVLSATQVVLEDVATFTGTETDVVRFEADSVKPSFV